MTSRPHANFCFRDLETNEITQEFRDITECSSEFLAMLANEQPRLVCPHPLCIEGKIMRPVLDSNNRISHIIMEGNCKGCAGRGWFYAAMMS